jgi:hypothetical protein
MKRRSFALVAVTALLAAGGFTTVATADGGVTEPMNPDWINEDGSIDLDKMPDEMPMVDSSGRIIPGKTVNMRELMRPPEGPPRPPTAAQLRAERDKGIKRITNADGSEEVIFPSE